MNPEKLQVFWSCTLIHENVLVVSSTRYIHIQTFQTVVFSKKKYAHYSRVLVVTELAVSGTQYKWNGFQIQLICTDLLEN